MARREIDTIWDRETRNNINDNFIELYNEYIGAGLDAKEARQKAEEAIKKANSVQEQLNQVVIEGDSSVEAAQARVDAEGNTYSTLKERLDEKETEFSSQLAQIASQFGELTQDYDLTVTVGEDGDFLTINQALWYLSKKNVLYNRDGYKAEILLKSGFIMREQVLIRGVDLGFITISSEDTEVEIQRGFLTETFPVTDYETARPAFGVADNGVLPVVNTLFVMNEFGPFGGQHGIMVADNGRAIIRQGCGVKNAGSAGLYVFNSGHAVAFGAVFDNAKDTGVICFRGSYVNFRESSAKNAAVNGIYMGSSSIVEAMWADFSGAGNRGVWAYGNGKINIRNGKLIDCGGEGIFAHYNAIVSCAGMEIINAGKQGIYAEGNARIDAGRAVIQDCAEEGIRVEKMARINASETSVTGCGGLAGIYAFRGGEVVADNSTIKHNVSYGIYANRGSTINADSSDISENQHVARDIQIARGSTINIVDSSGRTGSFLLNELTADGVIYK